MKQWLVLLSLWLAVALPAMAQDELLEDPSRVFMYGVNINTAGGVIGGINLRYSFLTNQKNQYQHIGFEFNMVKHPKEIRVASRNSTSSFIPNKLNYLFVMRPEYGRELVLFRKAPEEGVQLKFILAAGPSIGMVKPYYVLYNANNADPNRAVSVPYNPDMNQGFIFGPGSVFDGWDNLQYEFGMHVRPALNFEISRSRTSSSGIEAGFLFERFSNDIDLMHLAPATRAVNAAYVTFFYCRKY